MESVANRTPILKSILKPWHIRIGLGAVTALGGYDAASSQFGLPTLRTAIGMSGALMPWWGWLLVIQAILMLALFEYVRRVTALLSVVKPTLDAVAPGPPLVLRSDLDEVAASTIAALNKNLSGLRVDLLKKYDALEEAVMNERTQIYEDLKNAEDARLGQIATIRTDVTVVRDAAKATEVDADALLAWATTYSESRLLRKLAEALPNLNEMEPNPDPELRVKEFDAARSYVRLVEIETKDFDAAQQVRVMAENAKKAAESAVDGVPSGKRPAGIDPFEFRRYGVAILQAKLLSQWIIEKVGGWEEAEQYRLRRMLDRYARHRNQ